MARSRARSETGGTRWRTGGEVKGKLANGVGSQYSHATSERRLSSITPADAHTSAASSRLNWRPHRFKWTRPFRGKKKSGFCACAIRFRTSYTRKSLSLYLTSLYNRDFKALECNFEMNLGKTECRIGRKKSTTLLKGGILWKMKWAWNAQFDMSTDCHLSGNVLYRAVNQSLSHDTGNFNCIRWTTKERDISAWDQRTQIILNTSRRQSRLFD